MARKQRRPTHRISLSKYPFTSDTYPGCRPPFSFFFTPRGIYRLKLRGLDWFLAERKLPPLNRSTSALQFLPTALTRLPANSFGNIKSIDSTMCPCSLAVSSAQRPSTLAGLLATGLMFQRRLHERKAADQAGLPYLLANSLRQ